MNLDHFGHKLLPEQEHYIVVRLLSHVTSANAHVLSLKTRVELNIQNNGA